MPKRVAVIVNPTKFEDLDEVRRRATRACTRHGWEEPLWIETTAEDTGAGQARQAAAASVDLVCPLGGDGTVRAVAAEMVGTGIPVGLLPGGTGNLLARNLELPIDSLDRAFEVALTGRDAAIDTCVVEFVRPTTGQLQGRLEDDEDPAKVVDFSDAVDDRGSEEVRERHRFLVMAGLGFDAEVMAAAPERLKARVGWVAYVVAGLQHLKGPQFTVDFRTDGHGLRRRRVRSVMIGNVGKLQGGMELLPDAEADDGELDAVLLSPDGIVGWMATFGQLVTRQRVGHSRVEYVQAREIQVLSDKPVEVELDGDPLGTVIALRVHVEPGSLLVRLPQPRRGRERPHVLSAISAQLEGAGARPVDWPRINR
ncbi:diacylglycerol/lipid kinase family protein [Ornithinimicrobium flavum]|uniref:diacylglycerol/lipid kinase family protein n=1 Tax=Ornithinimicrobium flavum TaxID=1288636 RepID=UPI001070483B|nr:diacylglycerol kinase family protein [Ornithinimicrobium flavum]